MSGRSHCCDTARFFATSPHGDFCERTQQNFDGSASRSLLSLDWSQHVRLPGSTAPARTAQSRRWSAGQDAAPQPSKAAVRPGNRVTCCRATMTIWPGFGGAANISPCPWTPNLPARPRSAPRGWFRHSDRVCTGNGGASPTLRHPRPARVTPRTAPRSGIVRTAAAGPPKRPC